MKKAVYFSGILLLLFLLSIAIVDAVSVLTDDINSHMWVNLIGRWQCNEKAFYQIEFKADGSFTEFHYGLVKRSGKFRVDGNSLVIDYQDPGCGKKNGNPCSVTYQYAFEWDTLILTTGDGELSFTLPDARAKTET